MAWAWKHGNTTNAEDIKKTINKSYLHEDGNKAATNILVGELSREKKKAS